jgi:hypothetical protein
MIKVPTLPAGGVVVHVHLRAVHELLRAVLQALVYDGVGAFAVQGDLALGVAAQVAFGKQNLNQETESCIWKAKFKPGNGEDHTRGGEDHTRDGDWRVDKNRYSHRV